MLNITNNSNSFMSEAKQYIKNRGEKIGGPVCKQSFNDGFFAFAFIEALNTMRSLVDEDSSSLITQWWGK